MNGALIFFIFAFVVIPVIKNIAKAKPAKKFGETPSKTGNQGSAAQANKNWAEVQKILQQKINSNIDKPSFGKKNKPHHPQQNRSRNAHGHSSARKQNHQRMHSGDANKNVFTESHQARVTKRDQRDRSERNRIEAVLHSKTNRSIIQDGNNSIDGWGVRGDKSGGNGILFLLLFALIVLLVLSIAVPQLFTDLL